MWSTPRQDARAPVQTAAAADTPGSQLGPLPPGSIRAVVITLPAEPASVGLARRWAVGVLTAWGLDAQDRGTAALVIGELEYLTALGLAAGPVVALGFTRFAYALLLPAMRTAHRAGVVVRRRGRSEHGQRTGVHHRCRQRRLVVQALRREPGVRVRHGDQRGGASGLRCHR